MADRTKPKASSVQDDLKSLMQDDAPAEKGPAADAPQSGWLPDPWKHVMETVTPMADKAGLLPQKGYELREAGSFLIPQNTTQLAEAALLATQPEAAVAKAGVKYGLPALERLAASGIPPAIARAALRGTAVGGVAKATGSGPALDTGLYAAGGSLGGEALGGLASRYQQSRAAKLAMGNAEKRGLENVTDQTADWLRATVGRWLPPGKEGSEASAERVIRAVWNGEVVDAVGAELGRLKTVNAKTPVKVIDLKPSMTDAGVVFEAPPVQGGMVWPPVRQFETPVGPGTSMERYGAVARRGQGALPGDTVPLGDALAAIEQAKARATSNPKMLPSERDTRLGLLGKYEDELAARADPRYVEALKEYGRAKQLHEFFQVEAPTLFESRTGRLSWDGYAQLSQRLGHRDPKLSAKSFSADELSGLGKALHLDLEHGGMAWGEPGRGPLKGVSVSRFGVPHASVQAPQFAWMPNWEQTAGPMRAKLLPAAIRAITGQAPVHLAPPPPEPTE